LKTLQKIGALFFIPVILFSSFGFAIDVHYCKGEVKSVALFGDAAPCEMGNQSDQQEKDLPPCHRNKIKELKNKNKKSAAQNGEMNSICCYNQTFSYASNQEVAQNDAEILSFDLKLVMILGVLCDHSFFSLDTPAPVFADYAPPLIRQDFSVLYQTFLI